MSFLSKKIDSEDEAKAIAKENSKQDNDLYTVILCHKSGGYYVESGDGGMIRMFEEIVCRYENGKLYK